MKCKRLLGAVLVLIMAASSLNTVFSNEAVSNNTELVVEESTSSDSAIEIISLDTEQENEKVSETIIQADLATYTDTYEVEGGYIYFDADTGAITGADTSITSADIPSAISNVSVISIGSNAFESCSSLTSITIPNSVTSIDSWAFYKCSKLTSITIPNSITSIGSYAFNSCSRLTSISMPNSVTSIGGGAFCYCSKLTSITIPSGVTSIGGETFRSCSSLMSITIPNSVTSIGDSAFIGCSSLTSITIPSSVTSIGDSAFLKCSGLTSITIPCSVISIGSWAFSTCSSLINVTIEEGVTSIGEDAFGNCSYLTNVNIPGSVTSIGEKAFEYCGSLTNLIISDGVTYIGRRAFYQCDGLTNITIPESVTNINSEAFYGCDNLINITIPSSVTSIGSDAFYYCPFETAGPIGGNYDYEFGWTETIPSYAFDSCNSLTSIDMPSSITKIGSYAFSGCSSLTNINIPNSVTYIDNYAFFGCSSLTSIDIPSGITKINCRVFSDCSNLTVIEIPNGVTKIDIYSFENCSSLSGITIPSSIESIADTAFYNCDKDLLVFYVEEGSYADTWATENGWMVSYFSGSGDDDDAIIYICGTESENIDLNRTLEYYDLRFYINRETENADEISVTSSDTSVAEISAVTVSEIDLLVDGETTFGIIYDLHKAGTTTITIKDTVTGASASYQLTVTEKPQTNYDYTIYTISFDYGADQLETKRNNHFATYSVYDSESGDTFINPAVSFYYSLFNGSSYDDYTKRIKQSICFAMAAFNYYGDNNKGYLNANAFLSDLNFENIYHNDVYEQDTVYTAESNVDTIGLIAGSRTLTFDDGDYTLIALGVRGAGYGKEWAGNFRVDTGEEHEGFALARDQVIEFLNDYIREYGITGNIKLWITGYSRAAATTNLTAAYLDEGYGIDEDLDVVLTPNNIYAYCFETPAGTRTNTKNSALYDNIISVVNPVDFVPKVAFSDWNFGRYGITLYTATPSGTYDYDELYKKVKVTYNSITGQTAPDPMVQWDISSIIYGSKTQDIFLDEYLSCIAQNGIGSQDNYCSTFQDTVMPLLGVFLAGDESTKAELNELVDELLDKELLDELTTNLTDKSYLIDLIIAKLVDELQEITKSTDLTESDVRKLLNALCNDYGTDLWALWANRGVIEFGHYPELCLSWILNSDEYYLGYGNSELSTRKVTVNCPVNVQVYDSKSKLVAEIVDDEVTNLSDVYISCYIDENGQKIIYLPGDEEFDVKITATDDGKMTYSVSEYDALNYSCEKIVNYYEVDISEGDTLNGVVENLDSDEGEYPLYYGDDEIDPSEILEDDDIVEYNVSLSAENGGSVYGNTSCNRGEYVKACAYADDGYEFAGWYDENGLVSDESEYRFCVLSDVSLTAQFAKTADPDTTENSTETSTETSTGTSTETSTETNTKNTETSTTTTSVETSTETTTKTTSSSSGSGGGGGGSSSTCTIKLVPNNGVNSSTKYVKKNGTLAEPDTPVYDGYTFTGWYTDSDCTTLYDFSAKVTSNFTLYGGWKETDENEADDEEIETEEEETRTETEESVIEKIVKVVIGSAVVTVETDGQESTYTMDTAPYIQSESSSTLVPLRFVAVAVYDDEVDEADSSDIVAWDSAEKVASIIVGNDTISFTAGSEYMSVNGKDVLMSNGVKAEITDGRMFIPFRALGEALGVEVDWDSTTKTAIYTAE